MNSIITTKLLSSKTQYAGRKWFYEFRELNNQFIEANTKPVADSLSQRYSLLTKSWDQEKNSEWICRIYLAAKMIMTATLQLNVLNYSESRNIRLTAPYLTYYSILALVRAIVYTMPEQKWGNGKLVEISHQTAINIAFDHIAKFDFEVASKLKQVALTAKAYRELISYRSPTSGDAIIKSIRNLKSMATLLSEVAQFNSEILEASVQKHANPSTFVLLDTYVENLAVVTIEDIVFFDQEDLYRLDYLSRKYAMPSNILQTMTEGHVEDFFGAWLDEDNDKDSFNPDENWQIIFDIP